MGRPYEYRGLMAKAWDLLRGDTSDWPDRAFYREIIERRGGPALDVGCGTGRLLLDYLGEGVDIDGVDNSPEMLDLCREKAAALGVDVAGRLFHQEMEHLDLPRRYEIIIVPSSSFQLLTDPADAEAALERLHAHLNPDGLLVAPFMSKLWRGRRTPPHLEWSDWFTIGERRRSDGAVIRRSTRARFDHQAQLEDEENRYEVLRDGVVTETELHARAPATRWYSQAQAVAAYACAGFTDVTMTRGFTFDPAGPEDTTFCVIGTRP